MQRHTLPQRGESIHQLPQQDDHNQFSHPLPQREDHNHFAHPLPQRGVTIKRFFLNFNFPLFLCSFSSLFFYIYTVSPSGEKSYNPTLSTSGENPYVSFPSGKTITIFHTLSPSGENSETSFPTGNIITILPTLSPTENIRATHPLPQWGVTIKRIF